MTSKRYLQNAVIRLADHAAELRQRDERHAAELAAISYLCDAGAKVTRTLTRVEDHIAYVDMPEPTRRLVLGTLYNLAGDLTDALHQYDKRARLYSDVFGISYGVVAETLKIYTIAELRTALLNVGEDNGRSVVDWCRLHIPPSKQLSYVAAALEELFMHIPPSKQLSYVDAALEELFSMTKAGGQE